MGKYYLILYGLRLVISVKNNVNFYSLHCIDCCSQQRYYFINFIAEVEGKKNKIKWRKSYNKS